MSRMALAATAGTIGPRKMFSDLSRAGATPGPVTTRLRVTGLVLQLWQPYS